MAFRFRTLLKLSTCAAIVAVAAAGAAPQSEELQTLRNRGKALYEEQRFSEAIAVFAQVVLDPGAGAQDDLNLAVAQYRNRDDQGALQSLTGAGEMLNEYPGAPYLRGLIARRAGELNTARSALERARELDPTDPAIRYNVGAVYAQLGLQEEAMAEFELVMAMGFDVGLQHYVGALYQHLQILLRQRRRAEANPEIALYQEQSQRLSPAARVPAALQQSRSTTVLVPDLTLAPADPGTARQVSFVDAGTRVALPARAGVAMGDVNLDGRQDWITTGAAGEVWLSTDAGYESQALPTPAGVPALGDFDRDGWADLYVAHPSGDRLYRNVLGDQGGGEPGGAFAPVETEGLPAGGAPSGVLWIDYDHEGDLDVLVAHESPDGSSGFVRLLRNQGGGVFLDVTSAAGVDSATSGKGATAADFDNDYDTDLLVWGQNGTALYANQRGGQFIEVTAAVGARVPTATLDAVAEDFDNDGRFDLVLATTDGVLVRRNLAEGTFLPVDVEGLAGLRADAIEAADINNDGYLDIVVTVDGAPRFFANAGNFEFVPFEPLPADTDVAAAAPPAGFLKAADLDGNGGVDLLFEHGGELRRFLQPQSPGRWLAISVTGIKNNLQGIGSNVEVKTGGSYQIRPLLSAPLHFGIGAAESVDVVRIRWPNGIVQNLLDVAPEQLVSTTELERLEGSCPFLYTWDGQRWNFVNEVLGAAPLGMPLAEGVFHVPDPDEYVFVRGEDLEAVDGGYEIRLTEELRETGYLDAVRILAIDHPEGLSFVPDESFGGPARPDLRLHAFDRLLPVRASDQEGREWSAALRQVDGTWAVPFEPGSYEGLATPHAVILELPEASTNAVSVHLYLTGWVYWAMGSINLAVDQDPGAEFTPISLEVPDGRGGWRTAIEDIGLPTAKNTTLVVDVSSVLERSDPRVRLRTTMRLYWDAAGYTVGGPFAGGLTPAGNWQERYGVPRPGDLNLTTADGSPAPFEVEVLAPIGAELRPRGFSTLTRTADGYETFDYQRLVATAPWEQHRGFYTRFGDVGDLVVTADDRYVVLGTGDEVAIRFAAPREPPPDGWRRDFLVYLHGWVKDGDMNTVWGDRVAPLPFHGMSGYPYPPSENFPDDPVHQEFLEQYLTRPARPINPPLGGRR